MDREDSKSDDITSYIAFIAMIGMIVYQKTKILDLEVIAYRIFYVSVILIASVIILISLYKKIARYLEYQEKSKSRLRELKNKQLFSKEDIESIKKELFQFSDKFKDVEIINLKLERAEKRLKEEKEERIREQKRRIEEQEQKRIQRGDLSQYFEDKDSCETLPEWAFEYDSEVIELAKKDYIKFKQEEECQEQEWQEVVRFMLKEKGIPSDINKKRHPELYFIAKDMLDKGKLKQELKEEVVEEKEVEGKRFYHAEELEPEKRNELLRNGYRHKPFIFLDGSSGNNLIIYNNGKSESDYHFCMKHLFAELDKENSKIEYSMENLRADVAFIYSNKKIALEIETGSNKELQVKNKVDWLNKNFDNWIFVCSRANKKHYRKYVDNKKSFCLTLKDAKEKLQQLIIQ